MRTVETLIDAAHQYYGIPSPVFPPSPRELHQVSTLLASISPTLNNALLCDSLRNRAEVGKFKSSIGLTNGTTSQFLVGGDTKAMEPSTDNDLSVYSTYMLYDLYAKATKGNIYIDDIMVSADHASRPKGIDASHLSKIWIINLDSAKRTLEVTSHHSTRRDNPNLSRNYGKNYCILRYKRIKEHLFMDNLFSTKTTSKSSRGNTFWQIFVTDKVFVYVFPMKIKSEVLQAVNQFAREIGYPDAIILYAADEKTSKALRKNLSNIGTTLK